MKHGKKLLRAEKEFLDTRGLDPKLYLAIKRLPGKTLLLNINTKEELTIKG